MQDNKKIDDRLSEDSRIHRLMLVAEDNFALDISDFKILEEINYIAQDIHYYLGGFHTEKIFQEAFEKELILRKDQFKYEREFPMEIIYKGSKIGQEYPDFVLYPNKKYFGLNSDQTPSIIVELKAKDEDINFDSKSELYEENEYFEESNKKNTVGTAKARQQLFKYLNSVRFNKNKLGSTDLGILINFSTELEVNYGGYSHALRDTQGAYLEVWQMKDTVYESSGVLAEIPEEMHLMYETLPNPLTRKEMIELRREMRSG